MLRHGQGEEDNGLGAQKGQHLGQGLGKVAALGGLEDRVQVGKLLGVGRYPALCTRRKRIAQPVHQPNIANIKDPTGVKAGRRLKCYDLSKSTIADAAHVLDTRNAQLTTVADQNDLVPLGGLFGVTPTQIVGAIQYENSVQAQYERYSLNGTFVGTSLQVTLAKLVAAPGISGPAVASDRTSSLAGRKASAAAPTSSSSYAWVPLAIPSDARYLTLDFEFKGLSPNDFLSVGINDTAMFQLENQYVADSTVTNTGMLDVSQWSGQNVQLFLGLVASDDANSGGTILVDNLSFATPEPQSICLTSFGAIWVLCRRRRTFMK